MAKQKAISKEARIDLNRIYNPSELVTNAYKEANAEFLARRNGVGQKPWDSSTQVTETTLFRTGKYVRVYHYVMPTQQMRASIIGYEGVRNKPARLDGHIWVPIDDCTTFVYNIMCAPHLEDELTPEAVETREKAAGRGKDDIIPAFKLTDLS